MGSELPQLLTGEVTPSLPEMAGAPHVPTREELPEAIGWGEKAGEFIGKQAVPLAVTLPMAAADEMGVAGKAVYEGLINSAFAAAEAEPENRITAALLGFGLGAGLGAGVGKLTSKSAEAAGLGLRRATEETPLEKLLAPGAERKLLLPGKIVEPRAPSLQGQIPSLAKQAYARRAFKPPSREADKVLKMVIDMGGEALPYKRPQGLAQKAEQAAQRALQENMVRSVPFDIRMTLGKRWEPILPEILEKGGAKKVNLVFREGVRKEALQLTQAMKKYALETQVQRDEVFKIMTDAMDETGVSRLLKTTELGEAQKVLSRIDGETMGALRESLDGMTTQSRANLINLLNGVVCHSPCVPIADILTSTKAGPFIREIRMAGMLSGLGTWMRNIFGTTSRIAINPVRSVAAGGIDWARATALGVPRERYASEFFGEMYGYLQGLKASIGRLRSRSNMPQDLIDFGLRTRAIREFGKPPPSAVGEVLAGKMGTVGGADVGTAIGKVTQFPFKALNWQDEFMFSSTYSGEMFRGAYRQAIKEGAKGPKTAIERANQILKQQAHVLKDLHEKASTSAAETLAQRKAMNPLSLEHLTLTEWKRFVDETMPDANRARELAEKTIFIAREGKRLDQFIDTLDTWDNKLGGLVSIPLPFRRTPANVMRETIRSSPAGLVTPAYEIMKGGVKETLAGPAAGQMMDRLGQAAAGTAMLYGIWSAMKMGLIEAEPFGREKGRADRLTKELAGVGQDSVRIGGYSVPIDRIEPIGTMLLATARAKELQEAGKIDAAGGALEVVAWELVNQAKNGAFLDSFAQFLDAATGEERNFKKFFQRLGGSFVPAAARDVRRAFGAPMEEVETKEGAVGFTTIPVEIAKGFTGQLGVGERAKLGTFGKERKPGGLFFGARGEGSPIAKELVRIGTPLDIPGLPTGIDKGEISSSEREIFIKAKGQMQEFALKRLMSNPRYERLSDEVKKRLVKSTISKINRKINSRATLLKRRGRLLTSRDLLRGFIQTGA